MDKEKYLLTKDEIKEQLLKVGFLISYAEQLTPEELSWWQGMCEAQYDKMLRLLEPIIRDIAPASKLIDILYGGNDEQ